MPLFNTQWWFLYNYNKNIKINTNLVITQNFETAAFVSHNTYIFNFVYSLVELNPNDYDSNIMFVSYITW